jgi:diguanylate cyclase (GGDEF)-like protein
VALAVRFRLRGVLAGGLFTVVVILALALLDGGPVSEHYPLVVPLGVVFALLAANCGYTLTLLRSDLQHRGEAVIDPLTGMLNRHALDGRVAELAEQARVSHQPIALILADLDHFKSINDRFGHARGDAVLAEAAYRIRTQLRAYDLAYRLGGEEFLVVLPGADLAGALEIAQTLRGAIEGAPAEGVHFTMSFGVSSCGEAEFDFTALLADADTALYAAKAAGRNRVRGAVDAPALGDASGGTLASAA